MDGGGGVKGRGGVGGGGRGGVGGVRGEVGYLCNTRPKPSNSKSKTATTRTADITAVLNESVQFSSRWYLCAWKSPYALHPVSQTFPQRRL